MRLKRGLSFGFNNKKGQVTAFVIIAILIVGASILVYAFFPQIQSLLGTETRNPVQFMQTCLEESVGEKVDTISMQGGSLNPGHYFAYQGTNVQYLCYTSELLATCGVEQPLLKNKVEGEIQDSISQEVENCFNDLKESFENKGYSVDVQEGGITVELLPKRIVLLMDYQVTLTRGETERYEEFNIALNNNLYELISIAESIVEWEATYGRAETTAYMTYYRDLKVEKQEQIDGTTIYILTDRNTEKQFQFASRSGVPLR